MEIAGGRCSNCGAELYGRYCGNCGQRVAELRPTLRDLVHELSHEFLHVDSKILQTAKLLLFEPGALTRDFLAGRRARFITPVRLYLVCVLIFLAAYTITPAREIGLKTSSDNPIARAAMQKWNRNATLRAEMFHKRLPQVMFVLMPLFALLVFAFYRRVERTYVPHLYFSIHLHAFGFLLLAAVTLVAAAMPHVRSLIMVTMLVVIVPYLVMALRRVYGGTWRASVLKATAITLVYWAFVMVTIGSMILFTVLHGRSI